MYQKESGFPDCWKVSSVVSVFKNVGEGSISKNYYSVSLLSVVSKVFEKLVSNRLFDHLQKCGLFSDFQYGFSSSGTTTDLLKIVSNIIVRAFNSPRTIRAVYIKGFRQGLASGSSLRTYVDWGRKWLVDFNAGKTQIVSFDRSNNFGAIDVKMDQSILEEKLTFKMLELSLYSKLDWES